MWSPHCTSPYTGRDNGREPGERKEGGEDGKGGRREEKIRREEGGRKYTPKVQLYSTKYIYQPPVKVPNELTVLNTQTQEVTCWNQLLSDEQLVIIHYCNELSGRLPSAMTLTVT